MGDSNKKVVSFKTRVVEVVKTCARKYQESFVEYDYLLCSEAFVKNKYCIVRAHKDNFLHLVGINSAMPAKQFFEKALKGTLNEEDFDFNKRKTSPKVIKGYVREKIKVLPDLMSIFAYSLFAEEEFVKNTVTCLFATSNGAFTLGIAENGSPKTLMKKNQLNKSKQKPVDLIMRKPRKTERFTEIVYGDKEIVRKYAKNIEGLIKL